MGVKIYDVNKLYGKMAITNEENGSFDPIRGTYIRNYYDSISNNNGLEKLCFSNIKTKLEIFKKYIEVFTEDFQSKCTNQKQLVIPILKLVVIIN